jgi:hypothetical protein
MTLAFLSYTMGDHILDARSLNALRDVLSEPGRDVYIDLLDNESMFPQEHLENMLAASSMLFLCLTPNVRMSTWVRRELALAKRLELPIESVRLRHPSVATRPLRSASRM